MDIPYGCSECGNEIDLDDLGVLIDPDEGRVIRSLRAPDYRADGAAGPCR